MSQSKKALSMSNPHKPSTKNREKFAYQNSEEDSEEKANSPSLKAIIFDEGLSVKSDNLDEGIVDYLRAFWKGLVGDPFGKITALIDPKLDPKQKAFRKAMEEPLTLEEQWIINKNLMSKEEVMLHRKMDTFIRLYKYDILNNEAHILPGAKEQLMDFEERFPALKAKYDKAIDVAEDALGLDHYRHSRRHYPGRSRHYSASHSMEDDDGNVVSPDRYEESLKEKLRAVASHFKKQIADLEKIRSSPNPVVKHRIKETALKYIKYIEAFIDEIENLEEKASPEEIKEAWAKRYGKDAPGLMGPWLKLKGLAATHISRYKHLASSKTPTVPPSTKTP